MENPLTKAPALVRYLAKLVAFLILPGLHLISLGWRKVGLVFVGVVLVSQVLPYLLPVGHPYLTYWLTVYPALAGLVMLVVALGFIVPDLPMIGRRPISKTGVWAVVFVIATTLIAPQFNNSVTLINSDHMCPEFCFGDVVVVEPHKFTADGRLDIRVGDVVAHRMGNALRINRVIAGPGQVVCVIKPYRVEVRADFGDDCDGNYKLDELFYFLSSDNPTPTDIPVYLHHRNIHQEDILGLHPVVVINWSGWTSQLSDFLEM
jgi:hypothetical protein